MNMEKISHITAELRFEHLVQAWKGATKLLLSPKRIEEAVLHIHSCEPCKKWRKRLHV